MKFEKIQCEQLCLVKQSGFQSYGMYIYNDEQTKLISVTDYYNGKKPNIKITTKILFEIICTK